MEFRCQFCDDPLEYKGRGRHPKTCEHCRARRTRELVDHRNAVRTIVCSFSGCENKEMARGLCMGHYKQQHRGKPLTILRPMVKDGRTDHPLHGLWKGIVQRCTNPRHPDYPAYGGAGKTICVRWLNDFWAFVEHVGPRPSPAHSIDRIDNARGYEPGNVRWATSSEQNRNKTRTKHLVPTDDTTDRYWNAHHRMRQAGKATEEVCVDCGEPAAEWAYKGGDPFERVSSRGIAYSEDMGYYEPLCILCHRRRDLGISMRSA